MDDEYSGSDYSFKGYEDVEVQTLSLGDGETYPKRGDALLVHYVGTLAKGGEEFDSSLGAGKPFKFQLGAGMVIRGWEVGVKRISLGERAKIKVAADFAYGAEGIQGAIPPFADLDFEVHLLAINGKYNKNATKAAKACVIQ